MCICPFILNLSAVTASSDTCREFALHGAANVPGKAVHQRHDLLSSELEAFRRAVFGEVLDLFLREKDLQSRAQTLSLQTTQTQGIRSEKQYLYNRNVCDVLNVPYFFMPALS